GLFLGIGRNAARGADADPLLRFPRSAVHLFLHPAWRRYRRAALPDLGGAAAADATLIAAGDCRQLRLSRRRGRGRLGSGAELRYSARQAVGRKPAHPDVALALVHSRTGGGGHRLRAALLSAVRAGGLDVVAPWGPRFFAIVILALRKLPGSAPHHNGRKEI